MTSLSTSTPCFLEFLDLRVDLGDRVVDEGMSTVKISDDLEGGDFDPFGKFLGQSINPGGNGALRILRKHRNDHQLSGPDVVLQILLPTVVHFIGRKGARAGMHG